MQDVIILLITVQLIGKKLQSLELFRVFVRK